MHKKFEINQTKIKGGCQSGRKVAPYESKSDLPLTVAKNKTLVTDFEWISLSDFDDFVKNSQILHCAASYDDVYMPA